METTTAPAAPGSCLPWSGSPLRRPPLAWHHVLIALALLALAYHGAGEYGWFGRPCTRLFCPCHYSSSYHHYMPLLEAVGGAALLVCTFSSWRARRFYCITCEGVEIEEHFP